ncbi:MAG: helix-hairpin-helix domain-containing protein [Bacteroidia bacterium]|nr:helix-hairpin-helix domain-containing protein [Bacteroidia bacterium]
MQGADAVGSQLSMTGLAQILAVLGLSILSAQVLPDSIDAVRWELQLEDQAEHSPEGIDWTQVADLYEDLVRHPIDLNQASDEELLRVPGMTPQLVRALRAHQVRYGPLLSLYELQAIPGFTESVYRTLRPYITVRPATELDLGRGSPRAPTWAQIRSAARLTIIQRLQRSWRTTYDQGRWAPETLRGALGDPYRLYTRAWLQANSYLSAAIIAEKDPYEPLQWAVQRRYHGLDFLSGHVAIGQIGTLERLILGDYILQIGQGLVFARGLGFGKGGDPILTLKQPSLGLVPYSSVNEYQFWRGAAATLRFSEQWSLTGIVSRLHQDGTPAPQDTTTETEPFIQTLLSSGLHRTPSEMARRRNLRHDAAGGLLTWRKKWHTAGATLLYQRFTPPLNLAGERPYRYFSFVGSENLVGSVFWDITLGPFNTFGEVAQSRSGGRALTASCIAPLHTTLDIALQMRHFDPNFHSFYAYTFAERPFAVQNEQGVYFGIRIRPSSHWEFSAFHDLYRFPWYRYLASAPSEGHESLVQVTYTIRRRLMLYLRIRHESKPYNLRFTSAEEAVFHRLITHQRTHVRLHGLYEINPFWRYQARIEISHYRREELSGGYLLYQDLRWQPNLRWSVSVRWTVYRITHYDARIYTYEAMPPTTFFIPGYYGEGQRFYVLLRWRPSSNWTLWLRVGQNLFRPPADLLFRRTLEGLLQVRYTL